MASIRKLIHYSVLQLIFSIILCFLPLGKGLLNNSIYALVAPYAGCQDNWFELDVWVYYEYINLKTAISEPLDANIFINDESSITLKFCVWNGTENTLPHEPVPYEDSHSGSTDEDLYMYDDLFNFGGPKHAGYLESWPVGKYCIYNVGKLEWTYTSHSWEYGKCPDGFEPGTSSYPFIARPFGYGNTRYSPLGPFFTHGNLTSIEFCCSKDTKPSRRPISLPFVQPFYLLPLESKDCQPVKNAEVRLDWIQWPHLYYEGGVHPYIENSTYGNGTVFYMCYYVPNVNRMVMSLTYAITLGSVVLSLTFFFLMGWCHRKRLEWNHNRMLSLQYSGYNKDDSV